MTTDARAGPGAPDEARAPKARGRKILASATLAAPLFAIVRYAVLSRMLGPEQLGLAAVLLLTLQFFESATELGVDRFLLQSKSEDPRTQGTLQLSRLGRGVVSAAAIALTAWPIAHLVGHEQLAVPLALLGLSPLISSASHLDVRRFQRRHDFSAEAKVLLCTEAAALIAIVVAAAVFRDFTAVVYGAVARAVVAVTVSHLLAERRYVLAFDRSLAGPLTKFSTPLLLNGVLLFLGGQGDRLLVGGALGVAALGSYSAVVLLAYYPVSASMRYLNVTLTASVAGAHRRGEPMRPVFAEVRTVMSLAMAVIMVGYVVCTPFLVPLLFGPSFAQPVLVYALIALHQAIRGLRLWPSSIAMGMGNSTNVLAGNVARLASYPLAATTFALTQSLEGLLLGFVLGETVALATSLLLSRRRAGTDLSADLLGSTAVYLPAAGIMVAAWGAENEIWPACFVGVGIGLAALAFTVRREREALRLAAADFRNAARGLRRMVSVDRAPRGS